MSEQYTKLSIYNTPDGLLEGGGGQGKSNATYRNKCNFNKPRQNSRLNTNHLQCARVIKAIVVTFNVIVNMAIIGSNYSNPFFAFAFYSIWGSTIAFLSHIFSIRACNHEGWFKLAYISTEISFAVNSTVMIIFWGILWPTMMAYKDQVDSATFQILAWYMALIHAIPFITTVSDLWMTDMALEKSHWWIAFVTMCPFYMVANWIGAMTVGWKDRPDVSEEDKYGQIYGPEMWDSNIPLTILYFVIGAAAQGAIFYATAAIIDCMWPKRTNEEYELQDKLIDEENKDNRNSIK